MRQIRNFRQNRLFQGPLCHPTWLEITLWLIAILAIFLIIASFKGALCHLIWILTDFDEFSPYSLFSSNWPLLSKSLLWTEPLCHIIWLVHSTRTNFRHFHSFRQICHFRKNRHSQSRPLIISFHSLQRLWRSFVKIAIFQFFYLFIYFFFIASVWISLYSYISAKLIQVHWKNQLFFVCDLKCQPFLKRGQLLSLSYGNWLIFPATFYTWRYFETKLKSFGARISFVQWLVVKNLIFFSQSDSFQTRWIFYLWSWL